MMPLSCSHTKIATVIQMKSKNILNRCLLCALNKVEINRSVSSRRSTVPAGVNHVYGAFAAVECLHFTAAKLDKWSKSLKSSFV